MARRVGHKLLPTCYFLGLLYFGPYSIFLFDIIKISLILFLGNVAVKPQYSEPDYGQSGVEYILSPSPYNNLLSTQLTLKDLHSLVGE